MSRLLDSPLLRGLALMAGGALGAWGRAGLGRALPVGPLGAWGRAGLGRALPAGPGEWPWTTFAANTAGTIVLAWPPPSPRGWPQRRWGRRRHAGAGPT